MKRYQLTNNQQEGNTTVLTMVPATPAARLEFRAGQYVAVGFRQGSRRSPMRCFSLTSAPGAAGTLQIAFRRQGNFTDAMARLRIGDSLFVAGPFGSFCVPPEQQYPLVYLAAGVGITPFVSLLRDQMARGLQIPTTLLYSCRTLDDMPFAPELMQLAQDCPWLTVRFLVTQLPGTFQPHPLVVPGQFTEAVVQQFFAADADYYICGPKGYNKLASQILEQNNTPPEQIHTEAFGQGSKLGIAGFALQKVVYSLVAVALLIGMGGVFALDTIKSSRQASAAKNNPTAAQKATTPSSSSANTTTGTTSTDNTAPNSTSSDTSGTSSTSNDATASGNSSSTTNSTDATPYSQPVSSVS